MPVKFKTVWPAIEQAVAAGMSFAEAEQKFSVPRNTISKRATRYKWVMPKHVDAVVRHRHEVAIQKAAENWLERGEQYREEVFDIAAKSVKKFKPKAPKSFRELEAADKIARRAAGLDTGEVHVQTLINLNERMDNFEDEQPIEASAAAIEVPATVTPVPEPRTEADAEESAPATDTPAPGHSPSGPPSDPADSLEEVPAQESAIPDVKPVSD